MINILTERLNQDQTFREALLDSVGIPIFEATRDKEWGCGLNPSLAKNTKSEYYAGKNLLGKCLMAVREKYINESKSTEDEALQKARTTYRKLMDSKKSDINDTNTDKRKGQKHKLTPESNNSETRNTKNMRRTQSVENMVEKLKDRGFNVLRDEVDSEGEMVME